MQQDAKTIERVAVIGAGLMGAGIAAHCANAGLEVLLLDIVPDGASDRNQLASAAIAGMPKADPEMLMRRDFAKRITAGNLEDDLPSLAEVDWVVEAVVERLDIKTRVYQSIEEFLAPHALVSSNTSTIPRRLLLRDMSESFAARFVITHFFNPPRYMPLLEVVGGAEVYDGSLAAFCDFADRRLGKRVVVCTDSVGFIGNRIAVYFMQRAVNAAFDLGLTVEQVDAMLGRPVGMPKTGVFGLIDLVGLDLLPHVLDSFLAGLPEDDGLRGIIAHRELFETMIAEGYTGRKGKGGFYRLNRSDGKRLKEARDLRTGEYAPAERSAAFGSAALGKRGLRALLEHKDRGAQLVREVLVDTLAYAAGLVPEVSDSIDDVDAAMRVGFHWKRGPFEMIDQIGADWLVAQLEAGDRPVPAFLAHAAGDGFYRVEDGELHGLQPDGAHRVLARPAETMTVADLRRRGRPLARNASGSIWDFGDDILLVEFHSKLNSMDPQGMAMLAQSVEMVEGGGARGIVIGNDGTHFCAGANIGLALLAANLGAFEESLEFVRQGQATYMALKNCRVPVVAAAVGMCVGGGCEVLLHCDAVQAHAESYIGLVEVGVGIVPAWGGCKELLGRLAARPDTPGGPMGAVMAAFETIGMAKVAKSAHQAKTLGFLRPDDGITMNRARLLFDAKQRCLALADAGYTPPEPFSYVLPGPGGRCALDLAVRDLRLSGKVSPHDVVVTGVLARVLTGGDTDPTQTLTEAEVLELEVAAIDELMRQTPSLDRMEHMLETGKPLRN